MGDRVVGHGNNSLLVLAQLQGEYSKMAQRYGVNFKRARKHQKTTFPQLTVLPRACLAPTQVT